jgi:hypothetical protein
MRQYGKFGFGSIRRQINNHPLRIKRLDEVWEAAYTVVTSLFKEDLAEERLRVSSTLA